MMMPLSARKRAENSALDNEVLVNPSLAHAELIATFRRAEADAAHKFGLIKAVSKKGPKAIQTAIETAAKAAKRRDSFAKKLEVLGVSLKD
jgi:enoyl-CoA hydratase/carnithine racemase